MSGVCELNDGNFGTLSASMSYMLPSDGKGHMHKYVPFSPQGHPILVFNFTGSIISDTETLKYHKEFFIKLSISYLCLAIIFVFCFSILKHLFYLYLDESHRLVQLVLGMANECLSEDN